MEVVRVSGCLVIVEELFLNPLADGPGGLLGLAGKGFHLFFIKTGFEPDSPNG